MINVDEVKNVEVPEIDFPKIMQNKVRPNFIIFFYEYGKGTVLKTDDEKLNRVGSYYEGWIMEHFQDCLEPLVIRNVRKS